MSHQDLLSLTYSRGRVALHAILRGLDIGPGDHVATQAFTCIAVPEGILATGARPIYVDVEEQGFNLDPEDLRNKITPETRAIVVQHTFGIPAQMSRIMPIAEEFGLPVIEDCCHTLESQINGQRVGSFGTAAFYSYEWGKPIVVGIGGSARINDPQLRRKLEESLADYRPPGLIGRLKLQLQYQVHSLLYRPSLYWPLKSLFHRLSRLGLAKGNYNPVSTDSEEAAEDFRLTMAPAQRERLKQKLASNVDEYSRRSRRLSSTITKGLEGHSTILIPEIPAECDAVLARYPLRVVDKPRLIHLAKLENIELAEWYATPVHPLPPTQGTCVAFDPDSCPQARRRTEEIVSLPLHGRVRERDVEKTLDFLNRAA